MKDRLDILTAEDYIPEGEEGKSRGFGLGLVSV